jgi:hypothetical protein
MSDMKQKVANQAAWFKASVPWQKLPYIASLRSVSSVGAQTQIRQADLSK